jgi:hypothetical protein
MDLLMKRSRNSAETDPDLRPEAGAPDPPVAVRTARSLTTTPCPTAGRPSGAIGRWWRWCTHRAVDPCRRIGRRSHDFWGDEE